MAFEYGHTYTAYNANTKREVKLCEPLNPEWSGEFWIAEDEDGNFIIVSEDWLE